MKDLWKKQIENDMELINTRLSDMEDKLKNVEDSDKSDMQKILNTLQEIGESKQKDSKWKALGLFLLGGLSFVFVLCLMAITFS